MALTASITRVIFNGSLILMLLISDIKNSISPIENLWSIIKR
jgi:hypothetical protein